MRLLEHGPGYCLRAPLASFRVSSRQWSAAIGRDQSRQYIAFLDKTLAAGRYPLGRLTCCRGRLMARLNGLLRALVYRFVVRPGA